MKSMRNPGLAVAMAIAATACGVEEPDETSNVVLPASGVGPPGTTAVAEIPRRSAWDYYDGGVDQGTNWRYYWAGDWPGGPAPLGYGESYLATTISYGSDPSARHPTAYFRRAFSVGSNVRAMFLRVMYDDGFVFYINGQEGGRAHMPPGPVTFSTLASGHEAGNSYQTFDISSQIPNLVPHELNTMAVEVHQASRASSDLVFDAELIVWVDDYPDSVYSEGVPRGASWELWDRGGDLGSAWRAPGYDDGDWSAGPGPLGFGENEVVTETRRGPITTYFRADFTAHGSVSAMTAEVLHDDGFVAYLNGTEIGRASMPAGPVSASTLAVDHEAQATYHPFDWSSAIPLLDREGVNTLAVEVHQASATSSDLVFDLSLQLTGGWQPQSSGTSEELLGVWFLDAMRGWVVGANGSLLRTVDGGATWTPQASGTTANLVAIQFVDATHGWIAAADGSLLSTGDGGESWQRTQIAAGLTSVWFHDPLRGWLSSTSDLVYRTRTGGAGWRTLDTATDGVFQDIAFTSARNGWIIGSVPAEGDSWAAIYHTADGGLTWQQQWISGLHFFFLADLEALDATTAWAVGQSSLSGHGERKLVTRDGGATWTEAQATSNDSGIYGIEFVDPALGWGVGFHGSIIHTGDGGETWTVQQAATAEGATLLDVHFIDPTTGWAVGQAGTILRTTTGGE